MYFLKNLALPAARLIPPKCTSSQMCRSDTYVNCHYPHVVTMCPQVHACTPPPATLLWPFFHSSVIGHTSSDSRKPVDSLPTPSRMVVAERVRASGTRESPYAPLGRVPDVPLASCFVVSKSRGRAARRSSSKDAPGRTSREARRLANRLRWETSFSGA